MGEMVGEVRLICGRVAESGSNWRVEPQSPLELGPLGTVTASYYRITSMQPASQAVVMVGTMQQQSWEPHCVPLLTNLPELWKHPLKNNAYPPKSKLLAIC